MLKHCISSTTVIQSINTIISVAYCYTGLAISSPAVVEIIASAHCTFHGGMARLRGRINAGMVHPPNVVTNPSTNRARRSLNLNKRP